MKKVLRGAKWIFWTLLAVAVGMASYAAYAMFTSPKDRKDGKLTTADAIKERADRLHEEALVERAEAKAIATKQVAALQHITKIDDGKERRQKLAGFLKTL